MAGVSKYEAKKHVIEKQSLMNRCDLAQTLLTDGEFEDIKSDIEKFKALGQEISQYKVDKDNARAKIYATFGVTSIAATAAAGPVGATVNKAAKALSIGVEEVATMRKIKIKTAEKVADNTGLTENMLYKKLKDKYLEEQDPSKKEKLVGCANQLFDLKEDQFDRLVNTNLVETGKIKLVGFKPLADAQQQLEDEATKLERENQEKTESLHELGLYLKNSVKNQSKLAKILSIFTQCFKDEISSDPGIETVLLSPREKSDEDLVKIERFVLSLKESF
tara:strand:- start:118 stop:948 length:831 start_codon:yes stop_codon:yes gene_type:complete